MLIGAIAASVASAAEKPEKKVGRIKVYKTDITKKSTFDMEVQDSWQDVSPTKYNVTYRPCKDASPDDRHAFVVDAYVNDPTLPFPAAGRRGIRVAFPAEGGGPSIYIYGKTKADGSSGWVHCGEVFLATIWGSHRQADGTLKPRTRMWLEGTSTKDFRYALSKAADGRDRLIVTHITGVDGYPRYRRWITWQIVLGDWFATVALRKKYDDVKWVGYHRPARIVAIPGKGEEGKDVVLDAKLDGSKGNKDVRIPIDPATQRRYALLHRLALNWWYEEPNKGAATVPFVWWQKKGFGEGWAHHPGYPGGSSGNYRYVGRQDAMSAGLIRLGGLPIHQMDVLRPNTKLSKTIPPGRYRRMARVGKQWKLDQIVEVNENNRGKDIPAKVAGSEYLYLIDDLEERIFSGKQKK